MEMLEGIDVPEYFVTTIGKIESAGGGCVRIYACAERSGILVPMYCSVMPALNMGASARFVQDGVRDLFKAQRIMQPTH